MSEVEKIHDQLDGRYWQIANNKPRSNFFNRNFARQRNHSTHQKSNIRQHPFRTTPTNDAPSGVTFDQKSETLTALWRLEKKQDKILLELSELRGAQQQLNTKISLSLLQPINNDTQTVNERPVSTSAFNRFLNHFEENISELRQSIDRLSEGSDICVNLEESTEPIVETKTETIFDPMLNCDSATEQQNCAKQLLLLQNTTSQHQQQQQSKPLTMLETLCKFEPKRGNWKWRVKNLKNETVSIDDLTSESVEQAYKHYFANGQTGNSVSANGQPWKTFETDLLYINFDSRTGVYNRQSVAFERFLQTA